MSFNGYRLDPSVYDEMFLPDGTPREHARDLHDALSRMSTDELETIRGRVNRTFSSESISFTVYGDFEAEERIIPVDPIPRVVTAADWREVSDGLTQRVRALNYFLEDVYGEARIIDDGVIPEDMVRGCPQYRPEMQDFSLPNGTWVAVCGSDVVRTNDGFRVL